MTEIRLVNMTRCLKFERFKISLFKRNFYRFYFQKMILKNIFNKKFATAFAFFERNLTSRSKTWAPVAFSGIQPTGVLHIGNYFGAVKTWLELQETIGKQIFISIVDLHAMTEFREPKEMRSNILDMAASLIACGIDPKKCCLFQQSRIPQHSELAWILECFVTVPHLQRLTQFKDKSAKYKNGNASVGLLCYPVLQAADILSKFFK